MEKIPQEQVLKRIAAENPWWDEPHKVSKAYTDWRPRPYLNLFFPLVSSRAVRRAVVLLGPRRVGKTVLIHHAIAKLLEKGVNPRAIAYFSVDHPLYNGLALEEFLQNYRESSGTDFTRRETYVFFDEIQYLRDWEIHLKAIVDHYPSVKATASGSAAAALRLKSTESGAGRFTEFLLPPLTFHEYLSLLEHQRNDVPKVEIKDGSDPSGFFVAADLDALNTCFINYLNFGGYPEVVLSPEIQKDPARFVKADIIDKVLLRDLPSLYGIQDIQELNSLFTTLAFNTAQEVSLEELCKGSGVAKNTIKKYIEYLEAAFLIRTVHRIDKNARRFKRANFFKVYLTNPSMRSALFSPISEGDAAIGPLVETAIFSQWFHSETMRLHYARWDNGEVDIVNLDSAQKVSWIVEARWTDRVSTHSNEELRSIAEFCHTHGLESALCTSKKHRGVIALDDLTVAICPASEYSYTVGHNIVTGKESELMDRLKNEAKTKKPSRHRRR